MATTLAPSAAPRRPAAGRSAPLTWLLLAVALAHGALYAALTPPWQAPDEIAHFEYAWLLGQLRHPLWNENASPELERAIIQSLYDFHAWDYVGVPTPAVPPERLAETPFFGASRTLTRFSLSYVLYAAAALPWAPAGLITQLYAMRTVSVVLGALVVMLTYGLARLVDPRSPALAWGSALVVLLLPQHAYLSGAVNDGMQAELLATLALYSMVKVWRGRLTWPWGALSVLSGVGALLSKTTAVYLLPLAAVGALAVGRRWYTAPGRTAQQRRRAALGLLLAGTALIISGPFVLAGVNRLSSQLAGVTATLLETLGSADEWGAYWRRLLTSGELAAAWAQTFESFWGYFGWMVVRLPAAWLALPAGLTLLALLGWARRLAFERRAARPESARTEGAADYGPMALAAGLALVVLLGWFVGTPLGLQYSQGRYLFAAIAPLAVLLVGGWLCWRPARDHGRLLLALLAMGVMFDAAALWGVLVPYFYRVG